jgi:2-polyprenyl-3-methyl-5-hydroxy-6-metoxy-1,4-benzoquinol methylase
MGNNVTTDYGWSSAEGPESCSYVTPSVIRQLKRVGAKRVLDLGCGNGQLCKQLADEGFEVVGMDADSAGVEIARGQYSNPFYRMSLDDEPARLLESERPFDAVVSTEVVEHLYSPHRLPQFAAALLRPAGHLVVSTPYHGYIKNLALSVFDGWDKHFTALWHGGHIKFWSPKTLSILLEKNGFVVEAVEGVGRAPFLWKSMVVLARKR